jgi:hypothetical protein
MKSTTFMDTKYCGAAQAAELLNKLLDIIGEDALDIEPLQTSD